MSGTNSPSGRNGRNVSVVQLLCGASLTVVALAIPAVAQAQDADRNWDANGTAVGNGGTGTWNTTNTTWSPNTDGVSGPYVPWNNANLDNAIFSGTAGTVTLGTPITVHNITFNTANYIIAGNTLTLAGVTPTINNSVAATINSVIAGTNGLVKSGAGALTLGGANTFSGNVTLNAGSISVSNNAALGNASNIVNLGNGAILSSSGSLAGRTVSLAGAQGEIQNTGVGSAFFTGSGGVLLRQNVVMRNNANNYTGITNFDVNGSASFTSIGNLGEVSSLGAPTTVATGTITFIARDAFADTLLYAGDGDSSNRNWVFVRAGASSAAGLANSGTGTLTLTGDIALTVNNTFGAVTADLDLLGVISGTGAVNLGGSGTGRTITLAGANSYSGATTIGLGVANGVDVATVAASKLADAGSNSSFGTGAGGITIQNGSVLSYIGAGDSSNRAWAIGGSGAARFGASGSILNNGTGALSLGGDVTFGAAANNGLTLGGTYSGISSLSGVISGTGNLASQGSGTWVLSGANTRTGTILVNGGTLRAGNASAFGTTTAVTVNGGTLDLNGTSLVTPTLSGTGGTIALGTGGLTVDGTAASSYAGNITGTGPVGLTKLGTGTMTLAGQNSYTGATTIGGGTLALNFAAAGAPASNIIGSSSQLVMNGGTLSIAGDADGSSQAFGGLTVAAGNNRINATAGAGGLTVDLGAITRSGGLIDFGVATTANLLTSNADGLLGGWATVTTGTATKTTDYAQVVGGTIVAFSNYVNKDDAGAWLDGEVLSDAGGAPFTPFGGTVIGSKQIGGLKYTVPVNSTVVVSNGETLAIDGTIIVSGSAGGIGINIAGPGSVTGGTGGGTLGVQQNALTSGFQITANIVDNGGATGFAKNGAGLASLGGLNTYTGVTTVGEGVLSVNTIANGGTASAIGASSNASSNLAIQGATLRYTGASTVSDRGFTLLISGPITSGTVEVAAASTDLEFGGVVTSPDGAGLIKAGAGTLTLSGASNDYTGVTRVDAGTLAVSTLSNGGLLSSVGASSSAASNLVLNNGGRLSYIGGTAETNRGMTLGGANGRIGVAPAGTALTIAGTVTGSTLYKDGAGTLILSGNNNYTGQTNVAAGTLRAGSASAFGATNNWTTVDAGARLEIASYNTRFGGIWGAGTIDLGTAILTTGGQNGSFTGRLTGSGGFTRDGQGSFNQTLSGCQNDYTGVTTVASTLTVDCLSDAGVASSIGASSNVTGGLVFTNGTLQYTGGDKSINRGFTLQSDVGRLTVVQADTELRIEGQIVGGGHLYKGGAGTLILGSANTYTGETVLEGGTLITAANNALGTGGLRIGAAGTLLDLDDRNATVSWVDDTTGGGNSPTTGTIDIGPATLTISQGGGGAGLGSTANFGGAIVGSGGVVKNGGNWQQFSGCNNAYGGSTVVTGGALIVDCLTNGGAASSIGSSSSAASNLVLNGTGATFRYLGAGNFTDRLFTLGGSSSIDASGIGALVFTNAGAIGFVAPNTAQTVTLTGMSSAANTMGVQFTNNGTGATSLSKTGTGTWILANPNSTYTGITTISGGVLGVDKLSDGGIASSIGASALSASNLVIGEGSTLRYTGSGDSTNRLFKLDKGVSFIESSGTGAIAFTNTGAVEYADPGQARVVALGGTNTGNNIMGGSIGNSGAGVTTLAKNDAGTWMLTGTNTYTGPTNVNGGILYIGNGGTTGSIQSTTANITGGSTLGFNRSDAVSFTGTIAGAGAVLQAGAGTTTLTGTNTYTGGTTISAGTLQLGNGGATGSIVGNVANSGTLAFNRNNAYTFNGAITGTGTIAQVGTGTTTLTAANTAGATTISAGTLTVSGSLQTGTVAMTGSTLNVNGTLGGAGASTSAFTGDGGASTINVASGGTLRATGDLGGGSDRLTLAGTLNTGAGQISLGDGNDTFVLNDPAVLTGGVAGGAGTDALQVNNAADRTLTATQASGFETLDKAFGGILRLTGAHDFSVGTTVQAGVLALGDGTTAGSVAGNILNNAQVSFNSPGTQTYAGTITGTGTVVKNGTGTMVLTGNNAYSGLTDVFAGALIVNGDQSGAMGNTFVNANATLGGSGVIGGSVNVPAFGRLSPGNPGNVPGTLTINGNLTLASVANLDFEFGQANVPGGPLNDLINVGGNLTLDGRINVTQPAGGSFGPGVYRIINYAGTLTNNGLTVNSLPSGTAFVQTVVANQVNLVNTAGLTLNFWDGVAGPKNDGLIQGGNGTWRVGGGANNWTDVNGIVNADYAQDSFAIFQGTGGTVTVDNSGGNVLSAGMQFTVDGYTIAGAPLTLTGAPDTAIRVGDGGAGDASLTTTISAALAGATRLVKTDGGSLVLSGVNTYTGGTAINGGTLRISADSNLGDLAGALSINGGTLNTTASFGTSRAVNLAGSGTFLVDAGIQLNLHGVVSGTGAFVKQGGGTVILTADNLYTGGTTVSAGTLQIGNAGTTGSVVGNIVNNAEVRLARSDTFTVSGLISGAGAVRKAGGTAILTADNNYTGGTTNSSGILQLGNGGGTGGIVGDILNAGSLVFNRANEYTFAGKISASGDVRQAGSGTTILTGANDYTGATSVDAGTLLINGDQSLATGLTNVALGATLGGTGTIGGDVTLAGGAILAPGQGGPGTLTINGNLALAGTTILAYDFGQSNVVGGPLNDLTQVGGNLTLDGTIDVALAPGGSFGPGLYRVLSYGGTLTDNGLTPGAMPAGSTVAVQTSVAGQVNLVNAAGGTFNFWDGAAPANESNNLIDGGNGTWQNSTGNNDWTITTGAVSGPYTDGLFAIFAAAGGTVSVDNGLGAVTASGLQFASDGYTITGQDLTLIGTQSTIRVGDGTALGLDYTARIDAALIGSTQLIKADLGTLVLSGTNTYTGGTRIDAGTLRISSDPNLGDAVGGLSFGGGTLHVTADITSDRNVEMIGNGSIVTDAGASLVFTGALTGSGNLIKDGAGILALNDTSNHTGTTNVRAGSLFVNGDQSAALGLTSVATGATLGGSGIIGGDVVVADGATLAPGNSPGTLTINGDLVLSSGTLLAFEFGEANVAGGALNDLVNVGGNLTLDGAIDVSVSTGGTFGPGIYRVFNYGGALINNGLTLGTMPGGSAVSVQTAVAGQINLVNTAGLNLSFWDGDAGPKNNGAIDGGNGVWRVGGGTSNWTDQNGTVNADYVPNSFAIFSGLAGTVSVDNGGGNVLATGMQFASDGYVIAGGPLTLTGAQAIVQVGDSSGAGAGYTATISAELTGTAGLTKTDAGTLVLTGANSYTGGTTINGGTIRISADAGLGAAADGIILDGGTLNTTADLASSRAVNLAGAGTLLTDGGTTLTLDGLISGAGALTKQGAGSLVLTADSAYGGGTTITAGALQLGNGENGGNITGDIVDNGALLFNRSDSLTLAGTITGSGSVSQIGSGTTILTGANSYGGGTTISAGILQLGAGGTTGSIAGDVVNNAALVFNRSDQVTFAGLVSGAGRVEQAGPGTTILSAANSYAGGTTVSAGTLLVNGDQSAATGVTAVASSATLGGAGTIGGDVLLGNGATLAPGQAGAGTLVINGSLSIAAGAQLAYDFGAANAPGNPLNDVVNVGGNLTLDGTLNVAVTPGGAFDIGLYRVINYGGTLTDNGLAIGTLPAGADAFVQTSVANQVNLINVGGATLNFWDGAAGPKFNNAVDGGSGVWQAGSGNDNWADATGAVNAGYDDGAFAIFTGAAGTVTIDNSLGAVTASGLQFAVDGYTIAGDALTLTGPQSVIRIGDGTAAGAGYTATIAAELTGATQLVKTDAGTLVLSAANSYTGGTAINGGMVRIASDANLGAAAGGLSLNGGTLNTTTSLSSGRATTMVGAGTLLTDAGTTLTLTGATSGAGNLTKNGAGTLVLAGTGGHTGMTSLAAGTLLVNGSYAGAIGATSVASGASLGGTGTIGGDVAFADGATLTPGAGGAGTLTVNGDLSLAAGTTLAYEFGAANVAGGALNDLVNIGGDLVLNGTINVSVPTGGAFDVGVYRVFNYGGTLTNNGLSLGALPAGSDVDVQTSIAGQVNLVNSAGLTLSFWDGAAGPKNNGVINGGTGTWQNGTGNDNWTNADGTVNAAYSDGAFAVFGGTGGTVTVDNGTGQVTAAGMQFAANGYTVAGSVIALTGPQSTIRVGDGSTAGAGFTATVNAALSGNTQLVKTDAGTLVLGGTNSYTGGTAVNGGTLQIASDANLGAASGGVTLGGGTLATSANVTSARDFAFAGAGTIATASGTTFTLGGRLTGTGAFVKTGGGTLVLTGDSSGYAGSTQVSGTLAVNGSLCGDVNVLGGGRLQGTGTVCTTVNAGTVAPGNSIGTLTVAGNYTGNSGALEIEAELGGDASPADRLVVTGSTSGTTEVKVINVGGTGAATVEGIKIVDVGGASNGLFTLDGDYVFQGDQAVIAGAYGYRLQKNGVSTPADGDWYLRSSLLNAPTPNTPNVPLYQPGVPIYEAYGQTLLTLTDLGTLQQRIGNRQWAQTESGKSSGIWGRMQSNRSRPNAVRSTSLSDINVDSWKLELGADHVLSERSDGASLVLGVLGGYGEANASIESIYGNGSIKSKAYSAGATLTWFGPQGFYADSRAQVTWFDSKLKSAVLGTLADGNNGKGQAYSVEVGKRSSLGDTLSITPQIQMVYSTVGFNRFTDPNGTAVSSRLGDSLKSRWGLSIDRQDTKSHLYGVANLSYEWLDGTVTHVSGTPIARENHRLWGELGLGGSVLLGDRLTLYSEVSGNTAVNDFGKSYGLKGTAGLRLAF